MNKKFCISILFSIAFSGLFSFSFGKIIDSSKLVEKARKELKIITTLELVELLKQKPNTQLIDVRKRSEILYDGGFIKANKVTNISRDKLEFLISDTVEETDTFVVYCFNGNRSALASSKLQSMGYKNILYYQGSFDAWNKSRLPVSSLDKYKNSFLYSKLQKVSKGVYTSIGQTAPSTYENAGHNNNFGFIVGDDSVLVWNAGGSYLLAQSFHEEIKKITSKPVKYVVLENSQGHAMLGSSYWQEQGSIIVSHEIAKVEIIEKQNSNYLEKIKRKLKDKASFTKIIVPDITFKDKRIFDLGGRIVEAKYFGYAHEHSDISLWLPKEEILFAGDLAFHQRLLPIFKITEVPKWLEAWEKLTKLNAKIVIPGHGDVTNMATVTKYTKDYLVHLQSNIEKIIEDGGDLNDAYKIDMSAYKHLDTFKELGKQNIAILFQRMEFE